MKLSRYVSIQQSVQIADLERGYSRLSSEFVAFKALVERTMNNVSSLAVQRALERPPFDIPKPPSCLYKLGLIRG